VSVSGPLVIPAPDALPLPAPAWLLSPLLVLLFAVHAAAMSVALGGAFWAAWFGRHPGHPRRRELAGLVGRTLPHWTAAAITSGVAALLFLQVLYGPVFFAAAVVAAVPWLAVPPLLLLGYAGAWVRALRHQDSPLVAQWAGVGSWVALAAVAFLFVHQATLLLHPENHYALYQLRPSGVHLDLSDPALWPRFLHMVVGATAVAALWVAGLGVRAIGRGEEEAGRFAVAAGARGFAWSTLVQMVVGAWFLLALPPTVRSRFTGDGPSATGLLAAAVVLALLAMRLAWRAARSRRPGREVWAAATCLAVVLLLMALARDVVRRALLGQAVDPAALPAAPQWGMVALFALALAAGAAAIGWMASRLARATAPPAPGAPRRGAPGRG
jgi:hypothetical protein